MHLPAIAGAALRKSANKVHMVLSKWYIFASFLSSNWYFCSLFVAIGVGWHQANTSTSPSSPSMIRNGQTGTTTPASDLRNVQTVAFSTAFTDHVLQLVPLLNMSLLVLHHIFPMVLACTTSKHEASEDGEPKGFIWKNKVNFWGFHKPEVNRKLIEKY